MEEGKAGEERDVCRVVSRGRLADISDPLHDHTTTSPPKPPGSASHYPAPTCSLARLAIFLSLLG